MHPWDISAKHVDWSGWKPFDWLPWDRIDSQSFGAEAEQYLTDDFKRACAACGIMMTKQTDDSLIFSVNGSQLVINKENLVPSLANTLFLSVIQDKAKLQRICETIDEMPIVDEDKLFMLYTARSFQHLLGLSLSNSEIIDHVKKCIEYNFEEEELEYYLEFFGKNIVNIITIFDKMAVKPEVNHDQEHKIDDQTVILSARTGLGIVSQANAIKQMLDSKSQPSQIVDVGSEIPEAMVLKYLFGDQFPTQVEAYNTKTNADTSEKEKANIRFDELMLLENTFRALSGIECCLETMRRRFWEGNVSLIYCGTTNKPSNTICGLGPALGCTIVLWTVDLKVNPSVKLCAATMPNGICLVKDPSFVDENTTCTLISCPINIEFRQMDKQEKGKLQGYIKAKAQDSNAKIIGITTGGGSQQEVISEIIQSLDVRSKIFVVALGKNTSQEMKDAIISACKDINPNPKILFADDVFAKTGEVLTIPQMNLFYNSLDLLITKPSESTVYEAMTVGVPTVFKYLEHYPNDKKTFEFIQSQTSEYYQAMNIGSEKSQVEDMLKLPLNKPLNTNWQEGFDIKSKVSFSKTLHSL